MAKLRLAKRPDWVPFAWRPVTPALGRSSPAQKRDWQLVLDSRNIPFMIVPLAGREYIYAPPMLEEIAKREIAAYIAENRKPATKSLPWRPYPHAWLAVLFLTPLILFYAWENSLFSPGRDLLENLGAMDSYKMRQHFDWRPLFTALTLHSGARHLLDNMFYGSIFIFLLARQAGYGRAMLITVLGGALGNAISIYFHSNWYRSIGFSTALFACAGAMGALMFWRIKSGRSFMKSLAAVIAILAMLGTAGENTDYGAHIAGLFSGLFLGFLTGLAHKFHWHSIPQALAASLALALPLCAWFLLYPWA